jgi:tetratricopeptide (TPR) repeat protein
MDSPDTNETLAPTYVPMDGARPLILAPVLALDGLDPRTEIRGPALALDDAPEDDGLTISPIEFDDPAQLVLEPAAVGDPTPEEHARPFGGAPRARAEDPPTSDQGLTFEVANPPAALAFDVATPFEPADTEDDTVPGRAVAVEPAPPPAPDPAEILYREARDAEEEGRRDDAKRLYRELLGLRPTHVGARNNLALLLDADGNHQGALAELDRALELEPDNWTLLVNRGTLLGATGRFAAAERDLKKVLRLEPSHAEALFNLGVVMSKKGLWGEAVPHLRRAVELNPERGAAHYYLGEALNHVDDLYGALAAYQRAAELQPDNPRALYGLGIIYDRLARPDDAAQMYRRSREVGRR